MGSSVLASESIIWLKSLFCDYGVAGKNLFIHLAAIERVKEIRLWENGTSLTILKGSKSNKDWQAKIDD